MSADLVVVKVGGSLYDQPRLGPALRAFVASLAPRACLIVPGGGAVADAVRDWDRIHGLGEEAAHWIALAALEVGAEFLRTLLPGVAILDALAFCRSCDRLPHSWDATSDSLAIYAAIAFRASELVLLKSVDAPPNTDWSVAAERGWVDAHFPVAAARADFPIRVVDFRR